MTWLPYDKYEVTSKLTSTQIRKKFEAIAYQYPDNSYKLSNVVFVNQHNTDRFIASFLNDHIKIKEQRDIVIGGYVNSFSPEADIKLNDKNSGSSIKVIIHPNLAIMGFLCFAIIFMLSAVIFTGMDAITSGKYGEIILECISVVFFGYFLSTIAFNADLSKLKLFIDDLLEIEYEE